jgi:hypothetical protein
MLELFDQMVRERSGGEMLQYWKQEPMPAEQFVIDRMGQEVIQVIKQVRTGSTHEAERNPQTVRQVRESGELHRWMYDRYSLGQLLDKAGFVQIKTCIARESRIPNFITYGLDVNEDGSIRKPDSLFMEASKPSSQD